MEYNIKNLNNPTNKVKLKKSTYIIILFIPLLISLSIYFFIKSGNKVDKTINISEKGDINYTVCVRENDFYTDECLDSGMQYVASLINYIDINFNYELITDNKVDYKYNYKIESTINVFAKNDPSNIIYTDTEILLENESSILDKQLLTLKENVKINYSEYNEKIRKFKTEYGVSADSNVIVKLYIYPIIKYNEFTDVINKGEVLVELTIPLTENQINIKATVQNINTTKDYKDETKNINYTFLIIGVSILIITVIFIILIIIAIFVPLKRPTLYQKTVNKILREYDYIISETKTSIDTNKLNYQYIEVENFNELKDMALNTNKQILCLISRENKIPHETWFYIIDETSKIIYRYIINSNENKFKSKN